MLYRCYDAARLWTVGLNWPRGLKVWVCGVSPFLLNVGSGQLHVPAALPARKTQYPLNKGLGGPQNSPDVLKNRKIFYSHRESNLRRLCTSSDCAGTAPGSVQIRGIILVLAWKGDTTKILIQGVRNSDQYLKAGPPGREAEVTRT
jgi:hypothetical protein